MGIKNAKFKADFESVEKFWKKATGKMLDSLKLLSTALKDEKHQNPFTFINFCYP
jgi:hypothetical protein